MPYPWSEEKEQAFQRWWQREGKRRIARHPNPDHDRNEVYDWRAAWYFGFRNVTSRGVEVSTLPPAQSPVRQVAPESKVEVWRR